MMALGGMALLLTVAWLLLGDGGRRSSNLPANHRVDRAGMARIPVELEDDQGPELKDQPPAVVSGESREGVAGQSGAKVLSADGAPAQGAELTWTPISPLLVYSTWDWDEIDQSWWADATVRSHSDTRGLASPEPPSLADELGSIVWIDLDDHEPLVDALDPTMSDLEGRTYPLVASPGVLVRVVDARGQPVQGAIVEQHGVDLVEPSAVPSYAPLLFVRFRTTNALGTCHATRFPGRQALIARHGDLVSRPIVVDSRRGDVTLTLREGFTVSGTVTRPVSREIEGEIIPRITIGVRRDNLVQELATAVSRRDGTWGPVTVPCLPSETDLHYQADVHGVLVLPNVTPFPAPAPGDHVTLHLDAEAGAVHWFQAFDREEGVPLGGTTVTVSWEEDGMTRAISTPGRPDGYAFVLGIRPGIVRVTISRPGYCPGILPAVEVPAPTPVALSVVLFPCEQVSGRVVQAGEPVSDFELTSWPSADVHYRTTRVYHDRADGSFSIEASSEETLGIVASAAGSPGSLPIQVQVPESGLTGVEIELVGAIRGSGRVVRATDGHPVTHADVQPYVTGGSGAALTPWGPPLIVSAEGFFEGSAFREGANRLVISAPGLATREVYAESEGSRVDFGVIELKQAASLRVEVEQAADGRHSLRLLGSVPRSTTTFERGQGGVLTARIEDVPEGKTTIELVYPNLQVAARDITIVPGPNVARFRCGAGSLIATIHGQMPTACMLGVEMHDPGGAWEYFASSLSTEKTRHLVNLPAGPARIYLRDYSTTYASTTATILPGRETNVQLTISDADLIVRVVDAEEDAVSGAKVFLHGTEEIAEHHGGLTDDQGVHVISSLHRGTYVLHVSHPTLGLAPDRTVDFAAEESVERVIVLDGRATLDLEIFEGDLPLAGMTCRLLDRFGNNLSPAVLTNSEGRARIPRLTAGPYRLRVTSETIWPMEVELDVQPGAGLRTLQVRRLGDLLLRLINPDGVPVNGMAVDLVDEETGGSVHVWLDQGRVSGPEEVETDLRGEIALVGLPRGIYRWSAASSEGVLTVEAGKESLALLTIE